MAPNQIIGGAMAPLPPLSRPPWLTSSNGCTHSKFSVPNLYKRPESEQASRNWWQTSNSYRVHAELRQRLVTDTKFRRLGRRFKKLDEAKRTQRSVRETFQFDVPKSRYSVDRFVLSNIDLTNLLREAIDEPRQERQAPF